MIPATLTVPFTIVIDSREQTPFAFAGLRADARQQYRSLVVPTVVRGLGQGDYSIVGHEDRIACERKSLSDLFGTLGQGRERFERELHRLQALEWACVVIEAPWRTILSDPPEHSSLNPKTVFRSVVAWQQRFPGVHWWACEDRRMAEVVTFRVLERWWKDHESG